MANGELLTVHDKAHWLGCKQVAADDIVNLMVKDLIEIYDEEAPVISFIIRHEGWVWVANYERRHAHKQAQKRRFTHSLRQWRYAHYRTASKPS